MYHLSSCGQFKIVFMKKFRLIIAVFLLILIGSFATISYAGVCDGLSHEDCKKKINELEAQVATLSKQAATLSTQIKYMDSQINLTTAKITHTENNIVLTEEEIESLTGQIGKLNTSLDHLSQVLLLKITEGYKQRSVSVFDLLLDPESATTLLGRLKYMRAAQNSDHFLAVKLERTKQSFEEQKNLREEKKTELEELKTALGTQKSSLGTQKTQKQTLLTQTSQDETKYRQLLSQALAEYQAVQNALAAGSEIGPVKRGDPIALVGNTGFPYCSTGAHLHFEVRENNVWVDPGKYINGGGWSHPLQDPVTLTQGFGVTPYSWRYTYSGGIHTGYDMVSDSSNVIRAPADGTLFTSSQNCSGAVINIKYIEHGGGVISFYLHVQ